MKLSFRRSFFLRCLSFAPSSHIFADFIDLICNVCVEIWWFVGKPAFYCTRLDAEAFRDLPKTRPLPFAYQQSRNPPRPELFISNLKIVNIMRSQRSQLMLDQNDELSGYRELIGPTKSVKSN